MFDKYYAFRKMMDFMSDNAEVIDADMNCYRGCMRVVGKSEGQTITIDITIEDKEEEKDA